VVLTNTQALEQSKRPSFLRYSLWRALYLGLSGLVVVLLYLNAYRFNPEENADRSMNSPEPHLIEDTMPCVSAPFDRCPLIVSCETRKFSFNISHSHETANHWRLLDLSNPNRRDRFSGRIHIQEGDPSQTSDIEVRLGIRSSSTTDHRNIVSDHSESSLDLDYLPSDDDEDVCTEITLTVYFRPQSPVRILDVLEIRSNILEIWTWNLAWPINNLILHTSHGINLFLAGKYAPESHPRNISVSSITGFVGGAYVCDGTINLHTESGQIDLLLVPRFTTGRTTQPELISVSSTSGVVNIGTLWDLWIQQPFTHRTEVHTVSANISADIPHGSLTNLSSVTGNISAYLRPFAATSPTDNNAIYTSTQSGSTLFYLDNADREPLDELYDPLLHITSTHYVGRGMMALRYPFSWFGGMHATVGGGGQGSIKFKGSALDEVEQGEGYVKAVRGRGAGSRMEARVEVGMMDVTLGIWDTDG
jgi:hypothetical protein